MKVRWEYLLWLVLILLAIVYARILFTEQFETPARVRGKCPEGCNGSSITYPNGKIEVSCSKNDGSKCPVLDKCMSGTVEKDGMCMYCPPQFKLVGDKCVTIDPDAYESKFIKRAPCASGQTESDGACFESCRAGKKLDGFLCTSDGYSPSTSVSSNTGAPTCPAGYRYAAGSNSCMPNGGGEFICPSGNTMVAGGNGDKSCIPNERVQQAVASGQVTVVNSPTAPTNSTSTAAPQPTGIPSCGMESFAAF